MTQNNYGRRDTVVRRPGPGGGRGGGGPDLGRGIAEGIVCNMSEVGQCWDDAPVESFFGSLKRNSPRR